MEVETGGARRLRLRFDDHSILSDSQRSEGLRRCWLLLHPQELETVSDLASYLLDKFSLHHACPHGILLSMDGYVLPPFESTCILMDQDIIRVKKKSGSAMMVLETGDAENHSIDLFEDEEKQAALTSKNLLAIEDVVETIEDQSSDPEEVEELSSASLMSKKKRKRSVQLKRGKKRKQSNLADQIKDPSISDDNSEEGQCNKQDESYHQNESFSQKALEKGQCRKIKRSKVTDGPAAVLRCDQLQENDPQTANTLHAPVLNKKLPSRSARRKKAKRLWLREQAKIQMENSKIHMKEINQNCILEKKVSKNFYEQQTTNDMDVESEVIPVVVRPGHIRFEPLDDADVEKQKPMEIIQWNGTISKKRGQKWGREKSSVCEKNVDEDSNDDGAKRFTDIDPEPCHETVDFDKLAPLSSSPKVGDVVAYRLVELSSSWCPDLSPFRVGRVSWYDSVSKQVILVPVAEYPNFTNDEIDGDAVESTSLYKEDGSLEIDFSSLVDVRAFNCGGALMETASRNDEAYENNTEPSPRTTINGKDKQGNDPWEELSKALDVKKAQLLQEDGSAKKNWSKPSWSYKALRGSALGPTIALLRAQNDL